MVNLIGIAFVMLFGRWIVQHHVLPQVGPRFSRCCDEIEEDATASTAIINDQESEIVEEDEEGNDYNNNNKHVSRHLSSNNEYEAISPIAHERGEGEEEDDFVVVVPDAEPHMLSGDNKSHGLEDWSTLKYRLISVGLFLLYSMHFHLSELVLKKFQPCQNSYMAQYLWIPCSFEDTYYVTLVGLAIAFTCTTVLGIPSVMAYLLYRNRNVIRSQRQDRATEECLGFLYGCFKPALYWFEMAWLVRRLLLAVALAVIPEDDVFQAPVIVAILVTSLALHHTLKPLKDPRENMAEGLGLLALLVTYVSGQTLSFYYSASAQTLKTLILLLNLGVSAVFVGLLLWPFVKRIKSRISSMVSQ